MPAPATRHNPALCIQRFARRQFPCANLRMRSHALTFYDGSLDAGLPLPSLPRRGHVPIKASTSDGPRMGLSYSSRVASRLPGFSVGGVR